MWQKPYITHKTENIYIKNENLSVTTMPGVKLERLNRLEENIFNIYNRQRVIQRLLTNLGAILRRKRQ